MKMGLTTTVTLVLVVLKLLGAIEWPWLLVLSPILATYALVLWANYAMRTRRPRR